MTIFMNFKRGFSFWPFIVLPMWVKGDEKEEAYVAHEKVHCKRQTLWSPIWVALYFGFWVFKRWNVFARFRFGEEKKAFKAEIEKLLEMGLPVNKKYYIETMAEQYWGMCTIEEARYFVRGVIDNA